MQRRQGLHASSDQTLIGVDSDNAIVGKALCFLLHW